MGSNRFYTPDGFCDVMSDSVEVKRELESNLRELFRLHGYKEIETPGIEYCDVYTDNEFVEEQDLYKLCDQKGRLICLRYDGTVPAARFAATMLKDVNPPLRLCYIENMYRYNQVGGGKQSEFAQAGVELMGVKGSASDAEVIALAIKSALAIGIEDFQISIGQIKLFEGLMRQLGIGEELAKKISDSIYCKDMVTIERICKENNLTANDIEAIMLISEGRGTYDLLDEMKSKLTDESAINAIENLREILDILNDYGLSKYVTVDLGLLSGLDYYTGMIFKGFTYEVGFPIISGGRYDNTVKVFGREMESVGFSLGLSLAMTALRRQGKTVPEKKIDAIIGYDKNIKGARAGAFALAEELMGKGSSVIIDSMGMSEEELDSYAEANEICACFYVNEEPEGGND